MNASMMTTSLLQPPGNESFVYTETYADQINHSMVFFGTAATVSTAPETGTGTHISIEFGNGDSDGDGQGNGDRNARLDGDWSHFYDLILSWQGVCLVAVFCIFIVTTIVGNTLVILAVITTRRLKTVTNCFVMSLAVADLLVGIFVMPPAVAVHLIGSWQLGWILCDVWISLDVLLCTASILSLCAISVDRYLAVTRPLTYSRKRRSKRLALFMILIVWILALAITCPPMLGWYEPGRRDLNECRYNQNEGYVIFSAMGSFFIPMAVMIYVYGRISCVVASRHDNMTDIGVHNNNKKLKRYKTADIEHDIEHDVDHDVDLTEQELSSADQKRKKKMLDSETIVREVMLFESTKAASNVSSCSLEAISTATTLATPSKNGCYELTPTCPAKLQRPAAVSTSMTTLTGEQQWSFGASNTNADSQLPERQQQQQQQPQLKSLQQPLRQSSLRQHQLRSAIVGGSASSGALNVSRSQHESTTSPTPATAPAPASSYTTQNTRVHHHHHHNHQQQQHQHHPKSLSNRITSLKKENKTTQTLSIVVGGFIACWLPFFIYYLITPFLEEQQVSRPLAQALTWLGWFNSAINPFIYAFYSVDFRAAFWRLTCKRFFSTPKPQFTSNTMMSIRR